MTALDWTVVRTAATAGLLILVPGALLSGLIDDGPGWLAWLYLVVVLAGFTVAGFVAGRLRDDRPMIHGAVGAVVAFVVGTAIGLTIDSLRDQAVSLATVPLTALLALTFGVGGSLLADATDRIRRRRAVGGRVADAG